MFKRKHKPYDAWYKNSVGHYRICYLCKDRRGCSYKEGFAYTGCCGIKYYKIVKFFRKLFKIGGDY